MAVALQQPTEATTNQQPTTVSATVDASQLAVALRGALKATITEKQAIRGYEAVVCLELTTNGYLKVVATDGFRLHVHEVYMLREPIDIEQPTTAALPAQILVPVDGARALLKAFKPSDKWITLTYDHDNQTLSVNGCKPIALATDVRFLDWHAIGRPAKEQAAYTVHLDAEGRAVFNGWLKIASGEKVFLTVESDMLTFEMPCNYGATFAMLVEIDSYQAEPYRVGFDARYLRAAFDAFPKGAIELGINAKHGPATVHNDSAQYALLMPIASSANR